MMSLLSNTTTVHKFITACFDVQSGWSLRNVALSEFGWSLEISHNEKPYEWFVQGDENSVLFSTEGGLISFSIHAGNNPTEQLAAIWAVQPLACMGRWSWVRTLEEEEFTETL